MRTIKVARVDVVDAQPNKFAQEGDCTVVVCWRTEYMRTGQLHGAVAYAGKGQIIGELECAFGQYCGLHILVLIFIFDCCQRKLQRGRASTAGSFASQVGYESASQFSREVKRSFGEGRAAVAQQLRRSLIRLA